MSTNTLATNIHQAISDFADIKTAIIDKGVAVPGGTATALYAALIRAIQTGISPEAFLAAAMRTTYITGHGGIIDKQCEPFTNQIENYISSTWYANQGITGIDAGFEKLDAALNLFEGAEDLRFVKTKLDNLRSTYSMFKNTPLETFEVEGNVMPELSTATGMFENCTQLQSFNVRMPKLQKGSAMFRGCSNLKSFVCDLPELYSATTMFEHCSGLETFISNMPKLGQTPSLMFANCNSLETVNCDMSGITSTYAMFKDLKKLKTFTGDLSNLKQGNYMFQNCTDFETFNSNVSSLESSFQMFQNCTSLKSFTTDLSNLKEGQFMFIGCSSLTDFTASLSSLENGSMMFQDCDNLSVESLQHIITTVPDRSQTTQAGLSIGYRNVAKLSQEYKNLAAGKNWKLS